MTVRVFVTHNPEDLDAYYGRALPELEAIADVVLNPLDRDLTTAELIEAAAGCQVIVAHRATPGEQQTFSSLPSLVAFLRCAVDISTIDVPAASANGVLIAQADKSFVASTAELAVGLMIDAARNIGESTHDYRSGRTPGQRPGRQIRGQTAGIIGYGSIGSYLAALGMEVLVNDPFIEPDRRPAIQRSRSSNFRNSLRGPTSSFRWCLANRKHQRDRGSRVGGDESWCHPGQCGAGRITR